MPASTRFFKGAIGISIITGFLGSGKTTTLNALLKDLRLRDTAVVINEFGEIGLDHLLVAQGKESVVVLDSGCLCCTISDTLNQTLEDLYWRRVRNEIPHFKRVIVETTGLADPGPILRMMLSDYFISKHYVVNGVLTVVDALLGKRQLAQHAESVNQIAFADRIAISKLDLVDGQDVSALKQAIERVNRTVPIVGGSIQSADGTVSSEIIEFLTRDLEIHNWPEDRNKVAPGDHGHELSGEFRHDHSIESHSFYLNAPVSWETYASWLERFRALPATDLLRVKGLLEIEHPGRPYVIQGVQHIFSAPSRLEAWPTDDQRSRLVVIAKGFGRDCIEKILEIGPGCGRDRVGSRQVAGGTHSH